MMKLRFFKFSADINLLGLSHRMRCGHRYPLKTVMCGAVSRTSANALYRRISHGNVSRRISITYKTQDNVRSASHRRNTLCVCVFGAQCPDLFGS